MNGIIEVTTGGGPSLEADNVNPLRFADTEWREIPSATRSNYVFDDPAALTELAEENPSVTLGDISAIHNIGYDEDDNALPIDFLAVEIRFIEIMHTNVCDTTYNIKYYGITESYQDTIDVGTIDALDKALLHTSVITSERGEAFFLGQDENHHIDWIDTIAPDETVYYGILCQVTDYTLSNYDSESPVIGNCNLSLGGGLQIRPA